MNSEGADQKQFRHSTAHELKKIVGSSKLIQVNLDLAMLHWSCGVSSLRMIWLGNMNLTIEHCVQFGKVNSTIEHCSLWNLAKWTWQQVKSIQQNSQIATWTSTIWQSGIGKHVKWNWQNNEGNCIPYFMDEHAWDIIICEFSIDELWLIKFHEFSRWTSLFKWGKQS